MEHKRSEAQNRATAKWRKENMAKLTVNVKKDIAEAVKEKAALEGTTVNAVLKAALEEYLAKAVG